jgi:hypothetical protein
VGVALGWPDDNVVVSCAGFGYRGGALTCDAATCKYDRSGCQAAC